MTAKKTSPVRERKEFEAWFSEAHLLPDIDLTEMTANTDWLRDVIDQPSSCRGTYCRDEASLMRIDRCTNRNRTSWVICYGA